MCAWLSFVVTPSIKTAIFFQLLARLAAGEQCIPAPTLFVTIGVRNWMTLWSFLDRCGLKFRKVRACGRSNRPGI